MELPEFLGLPTPLDDFENGVPCADCGSHLEEEACYDGEKDFLCEDCMQSRIEEFQSEAIKFAEKNCKLTKPIPRFHPEDAWSVTREEYEAGNRECYTENSHACHCRHDCTNYNELVDHLDRDSVRDHIFYLAIRVRADELLENAIAEGCYDDED